MSDSADRLRGEVERVLRPMIGTRECPPLPIYPNTQGEALVRQAWIEVVAAALRELAKACDGVEEFHDKSSEFARGMRVSASMARELADELEGKGAA